MSENITVPAFRVTEEEARQLMRLSMSVSQSVGIVARNLLRVAMQEHPELFEPEMYVKRFVLKEVSE